MATACAPELYIPALRRLGVYELFDAFASLHEVPHGKSEPDVYLLAAQRMGCAARRIAWYSTTLSTVSAAPKKAV